MAKHLGDLGQGGTASEHLGRRCVTQPMGADAGKPCSFACLVHDLCDRVPRDIAVRSPHLNEDSAGLRLGAAPPKVGGDGLADVLG